MSDLRVKAKADDSKNSVRVVELKNTRAYVVNCSEMSVQVGTHIVTVTDRDPQEHNAIGAEGDIANCRVLVVFTL